MLDVDGLHAVGERSIWFEHNIFRQPRQESRRDSHRSACDVVREVRPKAELRAERRRHARHLRVVRVTVFTPGIVGEHIRDPVKKALEVVDEPVYAFRYRSPASPDPG